MIQTRSMSREDSSLNINATGKIHAQGRSIPQYKMLRARSMPREDSSLNIK